jgi:hypothetical protein
LKQASVVERDFWILAFDGIEVLVGNSIDYREVVLVHDKLAGGFKTRPYITGCC